MHLFALGLDREGEIVGAGTRYIARESIRIECRLVLTTVR